MSFLDDCRWFDGGGAAAGGFVDGAKARVLVDGDGVVGWNTTELLKLCYLGDLINDVGAWQTLAASY